LNVRKACLAAALALGSLLAAHPEASAQTTSAAASLNITPGARADAMGRAHIALCNDATASWWNPAALADVNQRIFSLMHTQLVPGLADDVYYEYLGYTQHVEGWGGVGGSLIFLTYGKSVATDANGIELGTFSSL
jgi:long-subunit fatty acid transport protein